MTSPSVAEVLTIEKRFRELGLKNAASDIQEVYDTATLPTLKYGFATSRFTWQDLKHIILEEKDLARLARSEKDQLEYQVFRHFVGLEYRSILDFLLITKFDFQTALINDKLQTAQTIKESGVRRTMLVKNDFPYYTEEGIVHYVLWKTNDDITEQDIEDAKKKLVREKGAVDTIHWINPPHLKSLPEIDHAHILCQFEPQR